MAIDYVIDHLCEPKDALTTAGILARLKGREQAERIIKLYRDAGDNRPYTQMGFEFTRSTPEGAEETQTIRVDELLYASAILDDFRAACATCPANLTQRDYGCFGRIQYPLSDHAERWLLLQLPQPHEAPLVWTLLGENLRELNAQSNEVQPIRESGNYFESTLNPRRKLGEIAMSGNNIFYLLFMQGHISPSRAAMLLLFFNAIPRNIDAPQIIQLTSGAPSDAAQYPYQHTPDPTLDDATIRDLKGFFAALHLAWRLNVTLLLDV